MMSQSPFDEALSRDFVADSTPSWSRRSPPTKKCASVDFSLSLHSASTLELTDDEEESLQSGEGILFMETIEFESAMLQERHTSFMEINDSLKHIHIIQKEISGIVDAQHDDVKHICWMSIDAKETAEKGLEHVKKATQHQLLGISIGDSTCFKYIYMASMALAGATRSMVQRFRDEEGTCETRLNEPLLENSERNNL